MKNFNRFTEFNNKSCIKNNLILSSIYSLMVIVMMFLLNTKVNTSNIDNGMADVIALVIEIFLFIGATIITTIIMPFFVDIYIEFSNNLKSLIGLWICNLIVSVVLLSIFKNYKSAIIYLLINILGSLSSLICKYVIVNKKVKQ